MLNWLFPSAVESRSGSLENPSVPLNDPEAWQETFGIGGSTDAGESVSHGKALTLSPVWKAVKMISGDISKLPLGTFTRVDDGKELDTNHPSFELINLLGMANEETVALQFWRHFVVSMLLFENGYAWIDRNNKGQPIGLYFLLPDRTNVVRINGRKWVVTEVNHKVEALPYDDCLHVPGLCLDGIRGCDAILTAREEIAQAIAARKFTSKFFRNGLHAGGVLQVPPGVTAKAKGKVEKGIANRSGAENAFRTLVLRDGFKWFQTMVDPQKAMLVEITDQKTRDIANFFLLWPGRLGVRDSISYNSIEQERRDYYDITLSYHLVAIKAELNAKLLTTDERQSRKKLIDYNVNALLWADAEAVAEIGYGGVDRGILTPDEVRGWWNLNPLPGGAGKKTRVPLNTAPANTATSDDPDRNAAADDDRSTSEKTGRSVTDQAANRDAAGGANVTPEMRGAVRTILIDTVQRCVNRWSIHADRATKAGRDFASVETDNVALRMIEPVQSAAVECRLIAGPILPTLRAAFVAARIAGQTVDVPTFVDTLPKPN